MIVSFLLKVIFSVFGFFVALLPTGTLPSGVTTSFSSLVGYMNIVNGFFPIDTLITLMGLTLAVQAAVMIWNLGHMLLGYMRGR